MFTLRLSLTLLCAFSALISASLFARSARDKISDCNSTLATCLDRNQKAPGTIEQKTIRERFCFKYWNECMDKAGAPKEGRRNPLLRPSLDSGKAPISGDRIEATPTPPKVGKGEKGPIGRPMTGTTASATATPHPGDAVSGGTRPVPRKLKTSPTPTPTR